MTTRAPDPDDGPELTTGDVPEMTQGDLETLSMEPASLDGHSIDELADYLDAGRSPADPSIDDSPSCQNALEAIGRVRELSHLVFEGDALADDRRDDGWVGEVLTNITIEAHAGRDVPLRPRATTEQGVLTEGAVRALIRKAGDRVNGVLIGRCVLDGDVETLGAPIRVGIRASVITGDDYDTASDAIRTSVATALARHTELQVTGIDVTLRDLPSTPRRDADA